MTALILKTNSHASLARAAARKLLDCKTDLRSELLQGRARMHAAM